MCSCTLRKAINSNAQRNVQSVRLIIDAAFLTYVRNVKVSVIGSTGIRVWTVTLHTVN